MRNRYDWLTVDGGRLLVLPWHLPAPQRETRERDRREIQGGEEYFAIMYEVIPGRRPVEDVASMGAWP